ncbi:hypothetical protein K440DRAFT_642059 [Wilcoxina mikolae CBS 423.85]|nr:hypothetical protein K440DRAFT_642059 [Wilcoxina mikolae CBS 423.85]
MALRQRAWERTIYVPQDTTVREELGSDKVRQHTTDHNYPMQVLRENCEDTKTSLSNLDGREKISDDEDEKRPGRVWLFFLHELEDGPRRRPVVRLPSRYVQSQFRARHDNRHMVAPAEKVISSTNQDYAYMLSFLNATPHPGIISSISDAPTLQRQIP